ncbi:bifunctional UDP-sugar hydrolase/5'-nucleotidase [Ahrensia sp. R2A130]|uniref:bifunctional metallophosphatase/5'-nucleotidase n=1 Tax=Ahrensia sp. R2A130 TaxID=744979 RepID=UPI0001E0C36B|nr:bifunctional UDP-sugar hydrolase/5'-nucleotidase [Ahrensia sp. R2A130]EFL88781.1 5'-nucleotidase [Ahrensia sp. R2A130]
MPTSKLFKIFAAAGLAAGVSVASMATALAETVNVSFIVASDMDTMSGKERGGVARLAAVVKAERAKGGNSIFVYPGDLLSPSILAGFDKGAHMIELLNMSPPDVLVPGNHEYDFGPDVFLKRMSEGKFPKLATNTFQDGKPIPGFETAIMKTFGDLKIGIIGLTTDTTPTISSPGNITFTSPVETAKTEGAKLREQGADVVVAVVHTAQKVDFDLLYSAGVDIVLSGHDHTLHVYFDGRRALVESKEEAEYVTVMNVAFDIGESRGRRSVKWWPNWNIIDTATVTPDAEVEAKVAGYEATLSKELDVELGNSEVALSTLRIDVRTKENAFGNLTADAMRVAVDADVAFTNGGGIRGNKQYDPGHVITRRDVLEELPFGNGTVKLEVTGEVLQKALEHGYAASPEAAGSFLHLSGMTATIDTAKPAGSRVMDVMVGDKALDPAATYTLATNDFMARGGDGYAMLREGKVLIDADSAQLMANAVMARVRDLGTLKTGIDGRLTIK